MSSVMNQDVIAPVANTEAPRPPWILAFSVTAVAIALVALVKWYQHAFSWTVGLDSFSDEFQVYWMRIFYAQIIGLPFLGAIGAAWLWLTRDRDIQNLPARDELARFYAMFSILVVAAIALISALGLLTEAMRLGIRWSFGIRISPLRTSSCSIWGYLLVWAVWPWPGSGCTPGCPISPIGFHCPCPWRSSAS